MTSPRSRLLAGAFVSCILGFFTQFAPVAKSQANVQGQWDTLPYTMPINPIHVALMHTGTVLIASGSGNLPSEKNFQAAVWDPQAGTVTTQPVGWDMFCNGMVVLPDGRPFIFGGTLQYDPFFGEFRTSTYDPATGIFTDQQSMAHGRWYPTGTVLGDGRVLVFSGLDETSATNTMVEIYTVGSGWGPAFSAPWTPPLYPRMHLLPNGNVFYSGSTTTSAIFNPANNTWTTNVAQTNYSGTRTYGSSVLLPLTPANGYKPRVMIFGGGDPSTASTEIIDLSAATPKWVNGPNMSRPRIEMDATILPNGKVLTSGGSLNDEDTSTASLNADLYDPNSNTFSAAGSQAYPRLYHSVTLLMPDATVWAAGGNPSRGNYEPHMEIYSPPYLFNPDGSLATRPAITGVPSAIGYGGAFQVQTPDAASISSVVLMRNGAVTHAFDMEQRYVGLSFTRGSGFLTVGGPPNGNVAPPGYYMLFILNSAGVPSVASMVQVSSAAADEPPSGTITSPSSNVTITAGQSVSYAGTGNDPDGAITSYSWSFPGGSPGSSNLANPGAVIYNAAGTYITSLTVTDNSGLTDPQPPTRTITVLPAGGGSTPINFGAGFTAAGLQFNGQSRLIGTRLRLTDSNTTAEVASAFWTTPVNVQTFTTDFQFQLTNPDADGFTFTLQGVSPTAIGPPGGGLGYGPDKSGGTGGIANSLAVKFDLDDNQGEGVNSTGLYTNGASPTLPATTFGGGVDLHSGDIFQVHLSYDGSTLTMTITDTAIPADTYTISWPINIPGTVGGNSAYAGFTAGTGGLTATQDILTWTFKTSGGGAQPPAINFGAGFTAGGLQFNGQSKLIGTRLRLTDSNATAEVASAFWTTPVNVQTFTTDFQFQLTNPDADGFTFTLQGVSPTAIGPPGGGLGYGPDTPGGTGGIANSLAVKFDLYDNQGEGVNSTGLYTNGASPTVPATTLGGGVDLHSGDIFQVHLSYDGSTLAMTITDTAIPADTYTISWPINIPGTVGGNSAYAGFTAGTGGLTATQEIIKWTY